MFLGERATEDLIQDKTNRLDNTPLKTLSIYCPYTVLYNVKCHKLDVTPFRHSKGHCHGACTVRLQACLWKCNGKAPHQDKGSKMQWNSIKNDPKGVFHSSYIRPWLYVSDQKGVFYNPINFRKLVWSHTATVLGIYRFLPLYIEQGKCGLSL